MCICLGSRKRFWRVQVRDTDGYIDSKGPWTTFCCGYAGVKMCRDPIIYSDAKGYTSANVIVESIETRPIHHVHLFSHGDHPLSTENTDQTPGTRRDLHPIKGISIYTYIYFLPVVYLSPTCLLPAKIQSPTEKLTRSLKLIEAFQPELIRISNDSSKHAHHSAMRAQSGGSGETRKDPTSSEPIA